ncbi:hypothetical protein N752_06990 [Desulforamulus aquiferis]|nr:hypothetical protein N752_06990 [Desulforamulus aquiferis]
MAKFPEGKVISTFLQGKQGRFAEKNPQHLRNSPQFLHSNILLHKKHPPLYSNLTKIKIIIKAFLLGNTKKVIDIII